MEHIDVPKACECLECMVEDILEMQYFQTIGLLALLILCIGGLIIYASIKEKI